MQHTICVVLDQLGVHDPEGAGLAIHGANLVTADLLKALGAAPWVEGLELFLPPSQMVRGDDLARAAHSILPRERRGKDILRFYPVHALPDVWSDARPRVLVSLDPGLYVRDRYLRDAFAHAPTPLVCETHALGLHRYWASLARLAAAPPVAYDAMFCLSTRYLEAMRKSLSDFLGSPGEALPCRLERVPHAIDTVLFQPADDAERRRARQVLGLPTDGQITMFLGRVTPYDKADLLPLVRAFARATTRQNDYLLIAGGEHPAGYGRQLEAAAQEAGIGDRFILHGQVKVALRPIYYQAADIFVFPGDTIQETFGCTIVEAMASGVPTVVSNWAGAPDAVVDGETGILIPTWWIPCHRRVSDLSPVTSLLNEYLLLAQSTWVDAPALARALGALLDDPALRRQMGHAGRLRAEQHFSPEAILATWRALLDELAADAAQEPPGLADERRLRATSLALPTPYDDLFAHYGSDIASPATSRVRLSDRGRAVAQGQTRLAFYDDTLALVRPEVMRALLEILAGASGDWTTLGDLTNQAFHASLSSPDDVLYQVALLLKHDLLEFSGG